jgi:peptidoglycan/LPS O-acetylase OafA/YrhL
VNIFLKGRKIGSFFVLLMHQLNRILALDGVRGLATLMVLVNHFIFARYYREYWWYQLIDFGSLGVDLFFVLSGFLITGILLRTRTRGDYFSRFYRRRVLRIFPLYYAVLLFAVVAILFIDRAPEHLWQGYHSLVWFFTFLPNVAISLHGDWVWQTNWAGLNHLWSLAVEEQFYVFWPLVVWLLPRRPLAYFCFLLMVGGVYFREWTDVAFGMQWSKAAYMLPYCHMDGLAGGSLLAILLESGKAVFRGHERAFAEDFTFLSIMGVLYWLVAENSQLRGTFVAFGFVGFVYLALCEGSLVRRLCENAFLRHMGKYSYGLYVFHQLFRVVYEWIFWDPLCATGLPLALRQVLYIGLAFGATYGLARLSFRYLETPFLAMKD